MMDITEVPQEIREYFRPKVRNGIAFLDQEHPCGWRDHVDLTTLDINDGRLCVIGQVEGDYDTYVERHALGREWVHEHGFIVDRFHLAGAADRYAAAHGLDGLNKLADMLTAVWKEELTNG